MNKGNDTKNSKAEAFKKGQGRFAQRVTSSYIQDQFAKNDITPDKIKKYVEILRQKAAA